MYRIEFSVCAYPSVYHDSIVKNIPTRKEANEFVDIMDDHGYDTSLWTVEPEVQHTTIID